MSEGRQDARARREAAAWFARLRGPATGGDRAAFERWAAADPRRPAAYARLEALWSASASVRPVRVDRQRRQGVEPRRRALIGIGGLGLATGLAAGLAIVVRLHGEETTSPVGVTQTVRLANGGQVLLDADSLIRTPGPLGSRNLALVRGRARFRFPPGARACAVQAGGWEVVCGAAIFDIDLEARTTAVALLEGQLELKSRSHGFGSVGEPVRLLAGEAVRLQGDTITPLAAVPGGSSWTRGVLTYDGAPLSVVVSQANRYSRRKIRLEDEALAALQVSGVFYAARPAETAESLARSFDLRLSSRPDGWLLSRA